MKPVTWSNVNRSSNRFFKWIKIFLNNLIIAKLIEEFPTDAALEAYNQQYYDLCRRENIKDFLIHLATNVKLKGSKFRGLAWRVFLGALGDDKDNWVEETERARANYKRLFDEFKV